MLQKSNKKVNRNEKVIYDGPITPIAEAVLMNLNEYWLIEDLKQVLKEKERQELAEFLGIEIVD